MPSSVSPYSDQFTSPDCATFSLFGFGGLSHPIRNWTLACSRRVDTPLPWAHILLLIDMTSSLILHFAMGLLGRDNDWQIFAEQIALPSSYLQEGSHFTWLMPVRREGLALL
jgi:hypothetical protein